MQKNYAKTIISLAMPILVAIGCATQREYREGEWPVQASTLWVERPEGRLKSRTSQFLVTSVRKASQRGAATSSENTGFATVVAGLLFLYSP